MTASDARAIAEFGQAMGRLVAKMGSVVILAAYQLPPEPQRQLLEAVSVISEDIGKLLDSITPTEGLDA